jgi:hypothetical protein
VRVYFANTKITDKEISVYVMHSMKLIFDDPWRLTRLPIAKKRAIDKISKLKDNDFNLIRHEYSCMTVHHFFSGYNTKRPSA